MEPNNGNFIAPANQVWFGAASREPSHSGSSTAMTTHSAGFEMCDELPPAGQAMSVCESTRKNAANGTTDCKSKGKGILLSIQISLSLAKTLLGLTQILMSHNMDVRMLDIFSYKDAIVIMPWENKIVFIFLQNVQNTERGYKRVL
jgi:hypothetical protein